MLVRGVRWWKRVSMWSKPISSVAMARIEGEEYRKGGEFVRKALDTVRRNPKLRIVGVGTTPKATTPSIPPTSALHAIQGPGLGAYFGSLVQDGADAVEEGGGLWDGTVSRMIAELGDRRGVPWLSLRAALSIAALDRKEAGEALMVACGAIARARELSGNWVVPLRGVFSEKEMKHIQQRCREKASVGSLRGLKGVLWCDSDLVWREEDVEEGMGWVVRDGGDLWKLGVCEELLRMSDGRIGMNEAVITQIVRLCVSVGEVEQALEYLKRADCEVRARTFRPILQWALEREEWELGRKAFGLMQDNGIALAEEDWEMMLGGMRQSKKWNWGIVQGCVESVGDGDLGERLKQSFFQLAKDVKMEMKRVKEEEIVASVEGVGFSQSGLQSLLGQVTDLGWRSARHRDQRQRFQEFASWLEHHGPFDIVLDGANLAHHRRREPGVERRRRGATHVSLGQVDAVAKSFLARGKKVLIVLHERWFLSEQKRRKGKFDLEANSAVLSRWEKMQGPEFQVYRVGKGTNDDWFWLFAAIWSEIKKQHDPTFVVTNDRMADHRWSVLRASQFGVWKQTRTITFDVGPIPSKQQYSCTLWTPPRIPSTPIYNDFSSSPSLLLPDFVDEEEAAKGAVRESRSDSLPLQTTLLPTSPFPIHLRQRADPKRSWICIKDP